METTEGILDDSLKDMRKHTESISCSTCRGRSFLSHSQCLQRLCMRVIHESSHTRCLHNTLLGQTPALSTCRRIPEEKSSGEVTRVVYFLLSLLHVLQTPMKQTLIGSDKVPTNQCFFAKPFTLYLQTMQGTTSSASTAPVICHGLQILAFNFLQTQASPAPGTASPATFAFGAISIESSRSPVTGKIFCFWTCPLSEGKQLIHTLLCFPSRFC